MSLLAKDHNGKVIQGFAPTRIVAVANDASLDVADAVAVRVHTPVTYQINGTGTVGTMAGVTVINVGVTSIVNKNGATVNFEVMD